MQAWAAGGVSCDRARVVFLGSLLTLDTDLVYSRLWGWPPLSLAGLIDGCLLCLLLFCILLNS